MFRDNVAVGDVKSEPQMAEHFYRGDRDGFPSCEGCQGFGRMSLDKTIWGETGAVGLANLLLDTLAPALAPTCARTLGLEASLSVHHCFWAWGTLP